MALDEPVENDLVKTINGIKVAIDSQIAEHTEVLTLDRETGPNGEVGLVMLGNESDCC
nr:hypothetical protein [Bacillus sp. Marseille-P3661]